MKRHVVFRDMASTREQAVFSQNGRFVGAARQGKSCKPRHFIRKILLLYREKPGKALRFLKNMIDKLK
jgi:hypothetical protein